MKNYLRDGVLTAAIALGAALGLGGCGNGHEPERKPVVAPSATVALPDIAKPFAPGRETPFETQYKVDLVGAFDKPHVQAVRDALDAVDKKVPGRKQLDLIVESYDFSEYDSAARAEPNLSVLNEAIKYRKGQDGEKVRRKMNELVEKSKTCGPKEGKECADELFDLTKRTERDFIFADWPAIDKAVKAGGNPLRSSPYYTIVHEIGHLLAFQSEDAMRELADRFTEINEEIRDSGATGGYVSRYASLDRTREENSKALREHLADTDFILKQYETAELNGLKDYENFLERVQACARYHVPNMKDSAYLGLAEDERLNLVKDALKNNKELLESDRERYRFMLEIGSFEKALELGPVEKHEDIAETFTYWILGLDYAKNDTYVQEKLERIERFVKDNYSR